MITEDLLKDIFKPKNLSCRTSITKVEPNRLITRGYGQEDLIGNISFPEMVYLLINGELPSINQMKMVQAVLVSFCDHGITPPSTQAARIMASTGSPTNTCLAGGILAFGENHAGAIEIAMKMIQKGIIIRKTSDIPLDELAQKFVEKFLNKGIKIPGFGHRYHDEDPRARRLMELAREYGCGGEHLELALKMQDILYQRKRIKINIDGANAAILSDMGFNWRLGCGFFIMGRIPGMLAHVMEEKTHEKPFRKIFYSDDLYSPLHPSFYNR